MARVGGLMSRRIKVAFYNRHAAYISGHGTRDLIIELRGRPPVWASRQKAWVTSEKTAKDVLACAEARGWQSQVSDLGEVA